MASSTTAVELSEVDEAAARERSAPNGRQAPDALGSKVAAERVDATLERGDRAGILRTALTEESRVTG
jgi:hypothetical protein